MSPRAQRLGGEIQPFLSLIQADIFGMAAAGCDHDVEFFSDAHAVDGGAGLSPLFEHLQGLACQHLDDIFFSIENNVERQLDTDHFTGFVKILAHRISRYPPDPGPLVKHETVIVLNGFRRGTTNNYAFGAAGKTDKLVGVDLADNDFKIGAGKIRIDPHRCLA